MAKKPIIQTSTVAATRLVKTSLHLPEGLHWRLTAIAAREGRDRSEFAAETLGKGLARHPLDKVLRELAGDEAGQDESQGQDGPGLTVRTG